MLCRLLTELLDILWPPRCPACGGSAGPADGEPRFCPPCAASLAPVSAPCCPVCALPFDGDGPSHRCGECLRDPPPFAESCAVFRYGGAAADAVVRLKYGRWPEHARGLGRAMVPAALRLPRPDVVVPVPLHRDRLRERGFNQSALLAGPVAAALGSPLDATAVVRVRHTRPQAGLSRDARRENLDGAFVVHAPQRIAGRTVLLLDDVVTTGATVREIGRALRRGGAARVVVAALARAC